MITGFNSAFNALYLQDEDALIFDFPVEVQSAVVPFSVKTKLPPEYLNKSLFHYIDEYPSLRITYNEHNGYEIGTVEWLMQDFVNALCTVMIEYGVFSRSYPPVLISSKEGKITLKLSDTLKRFTFGSMNLVEFIDHTFPHDVQGFCKDACIQEAKYHLPFMESNVLEREVIEVQAFDTVFRRSILKGSLYDAFRKQFVGMFMKFVHPETVGGVQESEDSIREVDLYPKKDNSECCNDCKCGSDDDNIS